MESDVEEVEEQVDQDTEQDKGDLDEKMFEKVKTYIIIITPIHSRS